MWVPGGARELAWLESVAEPDRYGMDVGPIPDMVFVLNPIYERVDQAAISDDERDRFDEAALTPTYRRVSWRSYADRHNIALFGSGGRPAWDSLPGIQSDARVIAPTEGAVDDELVWNTMFDELIRHSPAGRDTQCTAFWDWFWLGDPLTGAQQPNVYRGRLGEHQDLFAMEMHSTPLNVWPDDHTWVLLTYSNDCATQISGPSTLIDALIASPDLETCRPSTPLPVP